MDLSILDLGFERVPVECKSSRGSPYVRWSYFGMPSIPPHVLDCVVYLYRSREDAEAGGPAGGTGFLMTVPSPSGIQSHAICYAVTNWHVAMDSGASVIRVNRLDGPPDIFDYGPEDWAFLPGRGDVAAALIQVSGGSHKVRTIPLALALTREDYDAGLIGVGEDVFMLGRFVDHDGASVNMPAMRFGNISIGPASIEWDNSDDVSYLCLDMHSRTGFSGSPVIAYKTASNDLTEAFQVRRPRSANAPWVSPVVRLLGIHCGQFKDAHELTGPDGKVFRVKGYSGMTVVLPAWSVVELLNCDTLAAQRAQIAENYRGVNFPSRSEAQAQHASPRVGYRGLCVRSRQATDSEADKGAVRSDAQDDAEYSAESEEGAEVAAARLWFKTRSLFRISLSGMAGLYPAIHMRTPLLDQARCARLRAMLAVCCRGW